MLPLAVLAVLWVALFVNNLGTLPTLAGYDVKDHLAYIRHIQENGTLPLANQGWEMFQPPLYYLAAAGLLNLLSLSVSDTGGILALRLLGLVCGLAHCVLVWAGLRLLFPQDAARRRWGLVLAGCLPPMLYLSQYITNEGMAAALASASLYACLVVLRQSLPTWKSCAGLGVCLGMALLAKTTNVLLVPVVLGALIWRRLEQPAGPRRRWAGCLGLICVAALLVCGWHYGRVWLHFGNPLIGNWDPKTGFTWWQDDGYRTSAYYFRFGAALRHPWYAGFKSFGDGIYSTLWGDGLLGGAVRFPSRAPWNYELMAMGYWLSLLPALAVLAGAILALFKFIRQPSAEWFLLLGLSFLVAVALMYMSLVVPSAGQSKAFYGFPALMPFCALGSLGLGFLAQRNRYVRFMVCLVFGMWAVGSYASFWVLRSSVPYALTRGETLGKEHRYAEAAEFLKERLKSEPRATELRLLLVFTLFPTGDLDEAERQVQTVLQQEPENGEGWLWRAAILRQRRQIDQAINAARRSMALAPGNGSAYWELAGLLTQQKHYGEAVEVARLGLAVDPFSYDLRLALGSALLLGGQPSEASVQFRYACVLNPGSADRMNRLAWKWATDEDPVERNGAAAVKLAEQVCGLTRNPKAIYLITLAAADAETGAYAQAIQVAERAQAAALNSGSAGLVEKIRQMLDRFKSGQPYREKASTWN
jgi:tetratricopeptide (TPR) repeat protein